MNMGYHTFDGSNRPNNVIAAMLFLAHTQDMRCSLIRATVPVFFLSVILAGSLQSQQKQVSGPRYTKAGALLLPSDYRSWMFVTSGLGMTYGPTGATDAAGNPNFDNVFVNSTAYEAFLKSGAWPDKTVLIVEARSSDSHVSINKDGHVQTKLLRVEAHVKDSARGGWGFYMFEPGMTESEVLPHTANCYSCHEQNGAVDSTFVQFYPTLIEAARKNGTYKRLEH